MTTVSLTTELPIPAAEAYALAQKPALFTYVVRGVFRVTGLPPDGQDFAVGDEASVRLWWFGFLPGWRHHLKLIRLAPYEIATNERSGPVRVWNHTLRFEPLGEDRCRYTDEVALEAGPLTPFAAAFVRVFFRLRQHRWRGLARVLA